MAPTRVTASGQILLALFEELLQDEVLYLQKQEEHLAGLEEDC